MAVCTRPAISGTLGSVSKALDLRTRHKRTGVEAIFEVIKYLNASGKTRRRKAAEKPVPARPEHGRSPKLSDIAYDVLREAVQRGALPEGLVLLEGPIASCLEMSRVPVKSALKKLLKDELIHQFDGRGYLVGNGKPQAAKPLRRDITAFNLTLPEPRESSTGLFAWETIFKKVEAEIIACIPFGTYRVKEAVLCQRFQVSRTVAREVLSRLRDRGILEKDRGSQWIAGPLTAQVIREQFEVREIVEPRLLLRCAPRLSRNTLIKMLDQTREALEAPERVAPETIIDLEEALHSSLYEVEPNHRAAEILEHNQLPFVVNALYARLFGVERELNAMREHVQILEHLLHGLNEAAAAALTAHITLESERTVAALKVLSVIPEPDVADYLVHIA